MLCYGVHIKVMYNEQSFDLYKPQFKKYLVSFDK